MDDQCNSAQYKHFHFKMVLSDCTVRNGNGEHDQLCVFFLYDLSHQECHKYTTVNQVSIMQILGWVTDKTFVCLRKQLTREVAPSKCADVSDNTCTAQRTRKRSPDPCFPELVLQQVHRAPDTTFARLTCAEK